MTYGQVIHSILEQHPIKFYRSRWKKHSALVISALLIICYLGLYFHLFDYAGNGKIKEKGWSCQNVKIYLFDNFQVHYKEYRRAVKRSTKSVGKRELAWLCSWTFQVKDWKLSEHYLPILERKGRDVSLDLNLGWRAFGFSERSAGWSGRKIYDIWNLNLKIKNP